MTRYKTLGGMLSAAFAERGMCDDEGNLIQPIEEPISDRDYERELEKKIRAAVLRTTTVHEPLTVAERCPECQGQVPLTCFGNHAENDECRFECGCGWVAPE